VLRRTWHQQLRLVRALVPFPLSSLSHRFRVEQMLSWFGRLVANKLFKFPRGTNPSSYTQLYVAFFLSGLLHSSGDFVFEKRITSRSFKFFLLQAAGITLEDFVIYIAKSFLRRGGIGRKPGKADEPRTGVIVKVVGYCWVTLWLCLTLPVWQDELNALGFSSTDRGPIARLLLNRWNQGVWGTYRVPPT